MLSVRILHADTMHEQHEQTDTFNLVQTWIRWRVRYERVQRALKRRENKDLDLLARKIQAWHALCGITTVLKRRNMFNTKKGQPYGLEVDLS